MVKAINKYNLKIESFKSNMLIIHRNLDLLLSDLAFPVYKKQIS